MNRLVRLILKPLVFLASALPALDWLWMAWTQQLNANPFNAIVRSTGFWSLRFLCLGLAVTPFRWLTGWHFVVRFRRMLGLFAFFYATLHVAAYVAFDVAAARSAWKLVVDAARPFFAIGWLAFLVMIPLAVTSTAGMIRRLGGPRWQVLHRFVYLAAVASVVHTYWPLTQRGPIYVVILGMLFVLRVARARLRGRFAIITTAL